MHLLLQKILPSQVVLILGLGRLESAARDPQVVLRMCMTLLLNILHYERVQDGWQPVLIAHAELFAARAAEGRSTHTSRLHDARYCVLRSPSDNTNTFWVYFYQKLRVTWNLMFTNETKHKTSAVKLVLCN